MGKIISYLEELKMTERIRPEDTIFYCGTHIRQDYAEKYDIPLMPATLMGTAPSARLFLCLLVVKSFL